ncbi:MAG: carbamate kinase [Desulfobacterales bacterium]|nr:MAG: carbamate kinase [Desulfobacterales bacterium]
MITMQNKPIILIAFGGNALIKKGQKGTHKEQFVNLKLPMRQIARLSRQYKLVITHGNGPQVGNLLLQQESCDRVPKMPLEIIGAMTQGQIGYMLESSLDDALMEIGINGEQRFVTLITYVVVDQNDPGFQNPTKPIGPIYTEEEASKLPYTMVKTDKGFRRVVASPKPMAIVERREIKKLIEMDFIVICCGGGGIPVIRKERKFRGVEAVIDKDLASSILAREIKADIFVIASDIAGAGINWGTPDQRILGKVSLSEIEQYVKAGHFPAGSMGPKVEAITEFFKETGNRGIICHLEDIEKAIAGETGTEIY